jgi:hypothetical protein
MPPLDDELFALLDRARQVFGDEILTGIYERAQNAAIRQAGPPGTSAPRASTGERMPLVSDSVEDGFLRALRNELARLLRHH